MKLLTTIYHSKNAQSKFDVNWSPVRDYVSESIHQVVIPDFCVQDDSTQYFDILYSKRCSKKVVTKIFEKDGEVTVGLGWAKRRDNYYRCVSVLVVPRGTVGQTDQNNLLNGTLWQAAFGLLGTTTLNLNTLL